MKSRRDRAVIASFSCDTSIDPCATFKRESGNWRIDQAAWGHPASPAQLVGPVVEPPRPCVLMVGRRERKRGGEEEEEDNYFEVYCESMVICYVPIKNIDLQFQTTTAHVKSSVHAQSDHSYQWFPEI